MASATLTHRLLLCQLALLLACSKGGSNNDVTPADYERYIYVYEAVTNIPVAGATVTLQKCNQLDWEFGCINGFTPVGTFTTDAGGKAAYNKGIRWYLVEVSKEDYWPGESKSSGVTIYPVCYLKVRLVKRSLLAPGTSVYVAGQKPCGFWCYDFKDMGQPLDTTVYLQGVGNVNNTLHWYIKRPGGTNDTIQETTPVLIRRFDTAQVQINY